MGETAQEVSSNAEDTLKSATVTSQSLQNMAAEIEGVAKSAGDQDQQSREGEDVVEAMGATAKEVAGKAGEQFSAAQETAEAVAVWPRRLRHGSSAAEAARQSEMTDRFAARRHCRREGGARYERHRDSSEQINDIMSGIQSIAEQTNLLALNAALKRHEPRTRQRFAVVADEFGSGGKDRRINQ
jgi:methyl-accepting chemotaxis protein